MKIHADLSQRAVVDSNRLDWIDSPLPGVQRRMLDRDGAESGRATSIVRYAPGSHFDTHTHMGGEEFLVLEGVFSDEHGDFGPGMYVRNPVGSAHRPHSEAGCVIFVKLWQMDPDDRDYVRIDTGAAEWRPGRFDGLSVLPLHGFGGERVALVKWEPGARMPAHTLPGGGEILVLDGVLEDGYGRYPKGTWIRIPAGAELSPFSAEGSTVYFKSGHLAPVNADAETEISMADIIDISAKSA